MGQVGGGDPRPAPRRAGVARDLRHRRGRRQGLRPRRRRVPRPARQAQLPIPRAAAAAAGRQRQCHGQVRHVLALALATQPGRGGNRGTALGWLAGLDEARRERALLTVPGGGQQHLGNVSRAGKETTRGRSRGYHG
ncbi:hypothetical protein VPH35_016747 [Triticum aestivum]